jgi:hypothetical protein
MGGGVVVCLFVGGAREQRADPRRVCTSGSPTHSILQHRHAPLLRVDERHNNSNTNNTNNTNNNADIPIHIDICICINIDTTSRRG